MSGTVNHNLFVIPTKAGIQATHKKLIPAFAGMT